MARPSPKRPARRARKAQAATKPARKGKPPATPPTAPTEPPQAFFRGARLSLPDDEVTELAGFSEINDVKRRLFLQAIAQLPRIGRACRIAGITPATSWNWRHDETDVAFQEAFEVAWKLGIERAESELWRRGVEGYESPVYHQGRLVGTEREYDTTAAIFMLKGAKPETYRENQRIEHGGIGGGPIRTQVLDADAMTDEEIQKRLDLVKRSLGTAVKQLAEQAVEAKLATVDPVAAYEQALAKRNGNNGNGA